MLGITRVRSMLWGLAALGCALGALPLYDGVVTGNGGEIALGCAVVLVKAIAVPMFLNWNACRLQMTRDRMVGIGPGAAMLLGATLVLVCYFQGQRFASLGSSAEDAGLAIGIIALGLTIMMTRRLAVGLIVGFLVLDNGIFVYGFTQTPGMPFIVELGVLFDLFLGVLLAGFVLFRIRRSFEHLDVSEMTELRG
ncbi:MAG: hypothetical protein ACYC96_06950 [Fimbriimonadaceae bacterium]